MIPVRRLSHATYETPDLPRLAAYYAEVVGLVVIDQTPARAVLASRLGDETLVFERGTAARCTRLAFQVAPDFDLADVAPALAKAGIASERRTDVTPAIRDAVAFRDPKETVIELFSAVAPVAARRVEHGVAPTKLGHVAFGVPDARTMTDFYVDQLGFRVSDWLEDYFVFLRCGPDHHTANFRTSPVTAMAHAAFELIDWGHVRTACDTLARHKRTILWGPLRHGIGHNIAVYHRDPDENVIEFYAEMDQMKDEALGYFDPRPWHEDRPQRPKVWDRESGPMTWGVPPRPEYVQGRSTPVPR